MCSIFSFLFIYTCIFRKGFILSFLRSILNVFSLKKKYRKKIAAPKKCLFSRLVVFFSMREFFSFLILWCEKLFSFSLSFQVRPHFFFLVIDGVWVSAFEFFFSGFLLYAGNESCLKKCLTVYKTCLSFFQQNFCHSIF